ncbi:ABC transporter ATP-binding protein [Eubacterium multiforme]|uniref:NitT/TauT family transport system ATP-binding protein n=1 Tax=Eubacterium multiforme TaxID=83339 RepID=A0ABT9UP09_9FIRM|nr:ABC transporter ATP-binding protein [Eubacterium multiforme]MDQ0148374.1 NitT/TauT family transport system ATP-binding protein [Eubacterium multiforme]
MSKLILKNVCKSFGEKKVLDNFNLVLDNSKINCLIGESGKGKSTILNLISGLLKLDSGTIEGCNLNNVSYIFQEDRLIPWLTVSQNLKLALKNYYKGIDLDNKVLEVLKKVSGEDWVNTYPDKLSGGMKQRINIARALGKPSKVILMDEPFKSLDYKTKYSIMDEFKKIFNEDKRIVIFVTHDVDECIYFQGKVIVVGESPLKVKGVFIEELQKHKGDIINLL